MKRLLIGNLLAGIAWLAATNQTFAHARFIESSPAPDAALADAPGSVTIWFGELLEPDGNKIEVYASDGTQVDLGDLARVSDNHKALTVSLIPGLWPDTYRVVWQNLSAEDGHPARGEFSFTYGAPSEDEWMVNRAQIGAGEP